jgi:hypothetical protein
MAKEDRGRMVLMLPLSPAAMITVSCVALRVLCRIAWVSEVVGREEF